MPKGLLPVGAAAASALGGLFASDDAEAMPVAKFVKGVQHPYAQLRKLVAKNKQNGISPERTVTDWIHKNTNYEHIGKTSRAVEGAGGEHYKTQLQGIYDMLLDGMEPDKVDKDLLDGLNLWRDGRVGRDSSYTMPHVAAAAAATGAAGAAGAAFADESPEMGWREWPTQDQPIPTSPAERGFEPWSNYEPEPSYLDRVTDPATYADALRPWVQGAGWLAKNGAAMKEWAADTRVGKHVGEKFDEAMEASQMPGQAIHGLGRGAYGIATGESPGQALSAGLDVAQNDLAENGAAMKQWASDRGWHEDDAAAAGFATEFLGDPLTYAGMGMLGKIGKVF